MCKRNTEDPLVRKFLDDYGINLLRIPRERADCGDLYVKNGGVVSPPLDVRELLDPQVKLPRARRGEALADLRGTLSQQFALDLGLGLLDSFLAAMGAAGIVNKLKADVAHKRARGVRFRFRDATRDTIDTGALANAFEGRRFKEASPLVLKGNEYYVVGGVVRTPSISVAVEDEASNGVEVGADVFTAVSATAGVSATRESTGEVTYKGEKRLAIGVELYRLRYDDDEGKLTMRSIADPLRLRGRLSPPPGPVFVGDDDEALIELGED
jgi:hypothetical protein